MIFCRKCGLRVIVGSAYTGDDATGFEHGNCPWEIVGALTALANGTPIDRQLWFPGEEARELHHNDHCPPTDGKRCPRCFVRGGK